MQECNCFDGWIFNDAAGNQITKAEYLALPEDERGHDNCPVCNETIITPTGFKVKKPFEPVK